MNFQNNEDEIVALRKQLAEAVKENDALRSALKRKKHIDGYPDEILEPLHNLRAAVGRNPCYMSSAKYCLQDWFTQRLSSLIRGTVFADTAQKGKKSTRFISIQEMDAEEYQLWLTTLKEVLTALDGSVARRREMVERKTDVQVFHKETVAATRSQEEGTE